MLSLSMHGRTAAEGERADGGALADGASDGFDLDLKLHTADSHTGAAAQVSCSARGGTGAVEPGRRDTRPAPRLGVPGARNRCGVDEAARHVASRKASASCDTNLVQALSSEARAADRCSVALMPMAIHTLFDPDTDVRGRPQLPGDPPRSGVLTPIRS